jgi:UDP:flavonoid glycosyltransferase YjiC (YdhE family)
MITHAGIGTVKDCILHEVPMLAFPLMRDQPPPADRIEYHGLGLRGDIERVGPEELSSMLDQLITNESIRERVRVMREEFERAEAQDLSVTLIEKIIAGSLPINTL